MKPAFRVLPLAGPLSRCAARIALGLGVALIAHEASMWAAAAYRHESARRSALLEASADEAALRRFAAHHRELLAGGVIGPERRREWMAALTAAGEARRLPGIEYEFAPQQPATIETSAATAGPYRFMASPMKLHLGLAHEEDLVGFLGDLAAIRSSVARVRACVLARPAALETGNGAHLAADCELDWITLREAP